MSTQLLIVESASCFLAKLILLRAGFELLIDRITKIGQEKNSLIDPDGIGIDEFVGGFFSPVLGVREVMSKGRLFWLNFLSISRCNALSIWLGVRL